MALAIARTLGRGCEEPGMTLGSTAVGEDVPFRTRQSWGAVWQLGHARG